MGQREVCQEKYPANRTCDHLSEDRVKSREMKFSLLRQITKKLHGIYIVCAARAELSFRPSSTRLSQRMSFLFLKILLFVFFTLAIFSLFFSFFFLHILSFILFFIPKMAILVHNTVSTTTRSYYTFLERKSRRVIRDAASAVFKSRQRNKT